MPEPRGRPLIGCVLHTVGVVLEAPLFVVARPQHVESIEHWRRAVFEHPAGHGFAPLVATSAGAQDGMGHPAGLLVRLISDPRGPTIATLTPRQRFPARALQASIPAMSTSGSSSGYGAAGIGAAIACCMSSSATAPMAPLSVQAGREQFATA